MDEIRRKLGTVHVDWLKRWPWGAEMARKQAKACTIRPSETRPAYAALAELLESEVSR